MLFELHVTANCKRISYVFFYLDSWTSDKCSSLKCRENVSLNSITNVEASNDKLLLIIYPVQKYHHHTYLTKVYQFIKLFKAVILSILCFLKSLSIEFYRFHNLGCHFSAKKIHIDRLLFPIFLQYFQYSIIFSCSRNAKAKSHPEYS